MLYYRQHCSTWPTKTKAVRSLPRNHQLLLSSGGAALHFLFGKVMTVLTNNSIFEIANWACVMPLKDTCWNGGRLLPDNLAHSFMSVPSVCLGNLLIRAFWDSKQNKPETKEARHIVLMKWRLFWMCVRCTGLIVGALGCTSIFRLLVCTAAPGDNRWEQKHVAQRCSPSPESTTRVHTLDFFHPRPKWIFYVVAL